MNRILTMMITMAQKLLAKTPSLGGIFRDAKMQNKLILSFFALSFIPLVISAVFSVSSSSTAINEKISTYSLQLLGQVNQNISTSLLKIKSYSDDIIISQEVNNRLPGYIAAKDTDKAIIRMEFSMLLLLKFLNTDNVDDVLMILMKGEEQSEYDMTHVRV